MVTIKPQVVTILYILGYRSKSLKFNKYWHLHKAIESKWNVKYNHLNCQWVFDPEVLWSMSHWCYKTKYAEMNEICLKGLWLGDKMYMYLLSNQEISERFDDVDSGSRHFLESWSVHHYAKCKWHALTYCPDEITSQFIFKVGISMLT